MAVLMSLALITLILLLWILIQSVIKPKNFPPGPSWLPIVGCQQILKKKLLKNDGALYLGLQELAKDYDTKLLGLKLGKNQVVCAFGYELAKELLSVDEFAGRPDGFFARLRTFGTRRGIVMTDGPFWQEQRNFVMQHLREIGFGKREMELSIIQECHSLIEYINENGPHIAMQNFFAPNILSVLWQLTAGQSLNRNDSKLQDLFSLLNKRLRIFDVFGGLLNQMPWLRFIAPGKIGYNLILDFNSKMKNFFMETIEEHHKTFTGIESDLIYAFIAEMKARKHEHSTFTDDQLLMVCVDLFIAGSQTTNSLIGFVFYLLLLHPDIKDKTFSEIDANIPKSRMPELADRAKLPYVQALLMEVRRMFPIVAFAGPRRLLNDYKVGEYMLRKNTTALVSLWSIQMDEDYWKDPHVFRPDRFIGADGQFHPDKRVLNFGIGKRKCPGDKLAKDCAFLFLVSILQKFDVLPVHNAEPLQRKKGYPGLTMTPGPYNINFVIR